MNTKNITALCNILCIFYIDYLYGCFLLIIFWSNQNGTAVKLFWILRIISTTLNVYSRKTEWKKILNIHSSLVCQYSTNPDLVHMPANVPYFVQAPRDFFTIAVYRGSSLQHGRYFVFNNNYKQIVTTRQILDL